MMPWHRAANQAYVQRPPGDRFTNGDAPLIPTRAGCDTPPLRAGWHKEGSTSMASHIACAIFRPKGCDAGGACACAMWGNVGNEAGREMRPPDRSHVQHAAPQSGPHGHGTMTSQSTRPPPHAQRTKNWQSAARRAALETPKLCGDSRPERPWRWPSLEPPSSRRSPARRSSCPRCTCALRPCPRDPFSS